MTTTTFTNDDFFSDQVDLLDDHQLHNEHAIIQVMLNVPSMSAAQYVKEMTEHANAIDKLAKDNPDMKDAKVVWNWGTGPDPTCQVKLMGTKPWTPERIKEFKDTVATEKAEVAKMRDLIKKHPGKAAEALGFLLEEHKAYEAEFKTHMEPGDDDILLRRNPT